VPDDELSTLWRRQWPTCPPIADLLLPTTSERETIEHSHTGWLSDHPLGY
jgi:hypothetical protein